MTPLSRLLAWRSLAARPRRALLLLLGYGLGVGVMIALLAVGEALLWQAQDKDLVTGGDLVLLPEGLDPEVLKVGGVTAMYLTIPQARYLTRQVLEGPRLGGEIAAASPQIENKAIYLRHRGATHLVIASAGIPSRERAAGAAGAPRLLAWRDSEADRRWVAPAADALYREIDRFHLPSPELPAKDWAEWHYFNIADDASGVYAYISFIVAGDLRAGTAKGHVGVTLVRPSDSTLTPLNSPQGPARQSKDLRRFQGGPAQGRPGAAPVRVSESFPITAAAIPLDRPDLAIGPHSVTFDGQRYVVRLRSAKLAGDLIFRPVPHLYFPPVAWRAGKTFESGYVVPALRADAAGNLRVGDTAVTFARAAGYHDHNWGVWRGVSWEWGQASSPEYALLFGLVRGPDDGAGAARQSNEPQTRGAPRGGTQASGAQAAGRRSGALFVSLYAHGARAPRGGLLTSGRATEINHEAFRPPLAVEGGHVRVPGRIIFLASNGPQEWLRVTIEVTDVVATPVQESVPESVRQPTRGIPTANSRGPRARRAGAAFLQMRGRYRVEGRVEDREVRFAAWGFAETFVPVR
ncbi:MAG: hypothetical protein HY660_06955 [Armatimonadetes bacterium]|nr:hypothetical protein [Armatimonadota bacterium]